MTTVKTQLADFTHHQQKQRQEIASCGNGAQGSEDSSSSQWTSETKHRLLELANQQKELLKLFHRHKKLLEKIQALKKIAKSVSKHIIPAVEVHYNSDRGATTQQKIIGQGTQPSFPTTSTTSNVNPLAVTAYAKTVLNSGSKQDDEQFVNKHTSISLMNVPSSCTRNRHRPLPSLPTVSSGVLQPMADHPTLISHTPANMSHNILSATQTSVTPSMTSQPKVQNIVLTGGQLYQVGERQVYVLPQGLITSVTSSSVVTQVAQAQQVPSTKLSSNETSTASVTNKATVTQEKSFIPSSSIAKSTQGSTLNTIMSWQDQITQPTSQLSISNTPEPSSCLTLPISATIPLSNSSLPASSARSVSNSSTLQSMPLSTDGETRNQRKQATDANHSGPISPRTSEHTVTVTHLQKSTRVQSQHTTLSQYTSGVQSSLQAAKATATIASKGPVSAI